MQYRFAKTLQMRGLDTLVLASPENVYYGLGFNSPEHALLGHEVFAVVSADSSLPTSLIAPMGWDMNVSRSEVVDAELEFVPYGTYYPCYAPVLDAESARLKAALSTQKPFETAAEALISVLRRDRRNLDGVAFDLDAMKLSTLGQLHTHFDVTQLQPGGDLIRATRMIKDAAEIEQLRLAATATLTAIYESAVQATPGMTEQELAHIFEAALLRHGARPRFTFIGFGSHGAFTNPIPTNQPLKYGDVIRYDVGGTVGFYNSDIGRSFVVGDASPAIERAYRASSTAQNYAVQMMQPGLSIDRLFEDVMKVMHEAGLPHAIRKHIGHGIGLSVYDEPLLAPNQPTRALEPGMVFCVETPYYEIGLGGFQPEDMVVVTADGNEPLTTPDTNMLVLER